MNSRRTTATTAVVKKDRQISALRHLKKDMDSSSVLAQSGCQNN
jgi:hypothetical protein